MISTNSGTTFQVSTVERSKEPLPTTSYEASFRNLLNKAEDYQQILSLLVYSSSF